MINKKLQTQPLDPNFIAQQKQTTPGLQQSGALKTSPLTAPGVLGQPQTLPSDNLSRNPTGQLRSDIPAQHTGFSASAAPMTSAEAEMLLDVSDKLGRLFRDNRDAFENTMMALQMVTETGQVDFRSITPQQQQFLYGLGLNSQNTKAVFEQLYLMLLPQLQGRVSSAFETVMASATSFISGVDTTSQQTNLIEQQARDLTKVQGVVQTLSPTFNNLLADKKGAVYDTAVSKITSQNFDIHSGMEYTLSHFVVLSQQEPQKLQQLEGILGKVKGDLLISQQERSLLNTYGLNLNAENKLETIDRQTLSLDEVNNLERFAFSIKDPSEGTQKILQASADVISQSKKFEELAKQAHFKTVQVEQTSQEVKNMGNAIIIYESAAKATEDAVREAVANANKLVMVIDAAATVTGFGAPLPQMGGLVGGASVSQSMFTPTQMAQWGVQIRQENGQTSYFVNNTQVNKIQLLQHLNSLLNQQQNSIDQMSSQMVRHQDIAREKKAELEEKNGQLQVQLQDLKLVKDQMTQEYLKLEDLILVRDQVKAQYWDQIPADEQALILSDLDPVIDNLATAAQKIHQRTSVRADQALVEGTKTYEETQVLIVQVTQNIARRDELLIEAQETQVILAQRAEALDEILGEAAQGQAGDVSKEVAQGVAEVTNPRIYQSPEKPLKVEDEIRTDIYSEAKAQREAEAKIAGDAMDRQQFGKTLEKSKELSEQSELRAEKDREFLLQQQAEMRKKD